MVHAHGAPPESAAPPPPFCLQVIFSESLSVLDHLWSMLMVHPLSLQPNTSLFRIDGEVAAKKRSTTIKSFNESEGCAVGACLPACLPACKAYWLLCVFAALWVSMPTEGRGPRSRGVVLDRGEQVAPALRFSMSTQGLGSSGFPSHAHSRPGPEVHSRPGPTVHSRPGPSVCDSKEQGYSVCVSNEQGSSVAGWVAGG